MRKLLVALMMVAFAATAFAADVTFSGSYEFDGKYTKNYNLNSSVDSNGVAGKDAVNNSYYEHDLKLWMNVQTDKDTFLKVMTELVDYTVPAENTTVGTSDQSYADNTGTDGSGISVQRAWMGHNFGDVTVEAGLMDSGAWGYAFGDNLEGSYRVKATFNNVAGGKLILLTQKKSEAASNDWGNKRKDANKDDGDKYSIGYKGTFGDLFIAPKLDYDINSNVDQNGGYDGADYKTVDFDMAAGYNFGALALQAEYQLKHNTYADETTTRKDYDVYGAFVGATYAMGKTTLGALTAYGSVSSDNKNKGYDFNDDFDSTFILGDDMGLGLNGTSVDGNQDLTGFWATAIYATYQATDKLSLMGKVAYATSNWDSDGVTGSARDMLDGATAWEFDASANYAITKALNYYVNAGYAKINLDGYSDPDAIVLVKHGLVLSF